MFFLHFGPRALAFCSVSSKAAASVSRNTSIKSRACLRAETVVRYSFIFLYLTLAPKT